MIKDLLLPREKYSEASSTYGPSPFTFEVENDKQVMFYFAANHSHDPNNHQYPVLRDYWQKFLETSEGKKKIVLVEGGKRLVEENEETAIRRGAEAGLVTFLASKSNIPDMSPDPSLEKLAEQFPDIPKEEMLLMRFINLMDSYQRHGLTGTLKEVVERWGNTRRREETWKGIDLSFESMKKVYKKVLGKDFDLNENMNRLADPNKAGTRVNEIATLLSDAREIAIVSEIEKNWKEGKSIFVVFGSGHLIIQMPALEKLLI